MASISPNELARRLLGQCLAGNRASAADRDALIDWASHADPDCAAEGSRALFAGLVEPLADRFEPKLCPIYAETFAPAISRILPDLESDRLVERYLRIRATRPYTGRAEHVKRVYVLSRVTLGADVAVTSVILDAVKRRFPAAEIWFAGSDKCWELYEADPRLRHLPVQYGRAGTLAERLAAWGGLRDAVSSPGALVIDPDSRLTQLGLLPICAEERLYFFESRSYGGDGSETLPELTRRWVNEVFGTEDARPYIAPRPLPAAGSRPMVTMSLGVGENPAKRVPDPFEAELIRGLLREDAVLWIDRGAGGEERQRVDRALALSGARPDQVQTWDGAFAPFAARIASSGLYAGYDSAGQHVAAASGVPLISVFAGSVSERMAARWRPSGAGPIAVIRAENRAPSDVLADALSAAKRLSQPTRPSL